MSELKLLIFHLILELSMFFAFRDYDSGLDIYYNKNHKNSFKKYKLFYMLLIISSTVFILYNISKLNGIIVGFRIANLLVIGLIVWHFWHSKTHESLWVSWFILITSLINIIITLGLIKKNYKKNE